MMLKNGISNFIEVTLDLEILFVILKLQRRVQVLQVEYNEHANHVWEILPNIMNQCTA